MYSTIDEPALAHLVGTFYERVRADPLIGPVFNEAVTDWPEHLEKLAAFWSSVMLTSGRYKGQPLPAHARHGERIDARAFARWLELWRETTGELFVPSLASKFQEKADRIAQSLKLGISFARGDGFSVSPQFT